MQASFAEPRIVILLRIILVLAVDRGAFLRGLASLVEAPPVPSISIARLMSDRVAAVAINYLIFTAVSIIRVRIWVETYVTTHQRIIVILVDPETP